jgi:hypothetical protein
MTELKVHPAAEIFPMMTEEELTELADDIKAPGPERAWAGFLRTLHGHKNACESGGCPPLL